VLIILHHSPTSLNVNLKVISQLLLVMLRDREIPDHFRRRVMTKVFSRGLYTTRRNLSFGKYRMRKNICLFSFYPSVDLDHAVFQAKNPDPAQNPDPELKIPSRDINNNYKSQQIKFNRNATASFQKCTKFEAMLTSAPM